MRRRGARLRMARGRYSLSPGAGTGKTRVITERIRHLLQSDESLSGENILGLTFTNKAAGEMKARVVRSTGERGKDVTLATFHAFCEGLLKEAAPERLMIDKVDHWIFCGGICAAETRQVPAAGRSRAVLERLHGVFFAVPGRTGFRGGLSALCRRARRAA